MREERFKREKKEKLKNSEENLDAAIQNAINFSSKSSKKPVENKKKESKKEKTNKSYTNTNTKNEKVQNNSFNKKIAKTKSKNLNKKQNEKDFNFKKPSVKIVSLGGLEEIGNNMTIVQYEDEMILVDCGLEFPTDDMLGIDLVIPDISYIVKNQEKVKGLFITHGHEDHIGAIPYALKQVQLPIYATKLSCALIRNKLQEHKLLKTTELNEIELGDTVEVGKYFKVEFIRSCHSIPDAAMLAITTPAGVLFFTGDFKIDYTPINSEMNDLQRIAEIGKKGVLALLSDSTNSEKKGYTMSEKTVGKMFDNLFVGCTKRIVIATFASNVHRVQQVVNSAVKNGRKVAIVGRSMQNTIDAARELGYMEVPDNTFIDIDLIKNYPDDRLVIITTGSQGETMSALTKMAAGEHKKVTITPNDLVIISANPIPGDEKSVSLVIDKLMEIGAEVVYSSLQEVHVSGHACQEEQKLILDLVKPKYFIPVHGEYRQLKAHADTAKEMGWNPNNIFINKNGRILELSENEAKYNGTIPTGKILVDGLGVGDVGNVVLHDRQHLSQDGIIIIVMTMDNATGGIVAGPDVISRGFVYVKENETLMDDIKGKVKEEVNQMEKDGIKDWSIIKSTLKDDLRDYVFKRTQRDPMILPLIMSL